MLFRAARRLRYLEHHRHRCRLSQFAFCNWCPLRSRHHCHVHPAQLARISGLFDRLNQAQRVGVKEHKRLVCRDLFQALDLVGIRVAVSEILVLEWQDFCVQRFQCFADGGSDARVAIPLGAGLRFGDQKASLELGALGAERGGKDQGLEFETSGLRNNDDVKIFGRDT